MNDIRLELTVEETNLILEALGALPFARVYTLIARVQQSARQQLAAQQPAADAAVGPGEGANGATREQRA